MKKNSLKNFLSREKYSFFLLVFFLAILVIVLSMSISRSVDCFDKPALIINGEQISLDELRSFYLTYPYDSVKRNIVLKKAIDDLINYHLIIQEAKSEGLAINDSELNTALESFKSRHGFSQDDLLIFLNNSGISYDDFETKLKNDLLVTKVLKRLNVSVSDELISSYYKNHLVDFMVPNKVVFRQITFPANLSKEMLINTTNNILSSLQKEDFCEVAKVYSIDKTCNSYSLSRGSSFPRLESVLFNQSIGSVSLLEMNGVFYVVQTLNKLDFNPLSLDDSLKKIIRDKLFSETFSGVYSDYIAELRSDADIKVLVSEDYLS